MRIAYENNIFLFPQGKRCLGEKPSSTEVKNGIGLFIGRSKSCVIPVGIYTKDYRVKLFKRVYVVIGKPMAYEDFGFVDNSKEEYKAASDKVFSEICALAERAENGEFEKK